MNSTIENSNLSPGKFNNYLLGGNLTNAFAVGKIGSKDDFFLVGAEPPDESCYPLLTGNILDSEGNLLFKLVRNVIVINPGHCKKIIGDLIGYEIYDSAGKLILKVETKFEKTEKLEEKCWITTIKANLYNKEGKLVVQANSGEEGEHIATDCNIALGDPIGISLNYSKEELEFIKYTLSSKGDIYEPINGTIENEEFILDGKVLINATIKKCIITVSEGDFGSIGQNKFIECKFNWIGKAERIKYIVSNLK